MLSNLYWQPTDTPIYEKSGYTGDGQLMAGANSYLFDMRRFYTKWAEDIAGAQDPGNGELLGIVGPSPTPDGTRDTTGWPGPSPGWDVALFTIPDVLYRFGDDERPSVRNLDEMTRYRAWIESHLDTDGVLRGQCATLNGPNPCANGLGDWSNLPDMPVGVSLDSTAWYHEMMRLLAQAATLAGDDPTAGSARAQLSTTAAAFDRAFWTPEINGYRNDPGESRFSQHQQAIALGLGLVPADRVRTVAASLAADVRGRDNHLSTGIMGTGSCGGVDVDRSCGRGVRRGHTDDLPVVRLLDRRARWHALGENWPADTRSRSHMMFGTVVQWFFEDLAGYRPTGAGFSEIEFRPEIPSAGLDWVTASTDTPRGTVATTWRKTSGGLELEVTVPTGSDGVVHVPATDSRMVTESGSGRTVRADKAPGVTLAGQSDGRVEYRVGSGTYRFHVVSRG